MAPETPSPTPSRRRVAIAALAAAVVLILVGIGVFIARTRTADKPAPVPPAPVPSSIAVDPPSPVPSWSPSEPSAPADATVAWAFVDSTEGGTRTGGDDKVLDRLLDLVVPLVAADYLNANKDADGGPPPAESERLTAAMTGDRDAISWLMTERGGVNAAMERVIDVCQVESTEVSPPQATVLDIARLGACLREGAIVEPIWSAWVLDAMRANKGGIGDVRGSDTAQGLAQYNSTELDGERYRTACLAVGAWWSAAVTVEYPQSRGAGYGVTVCRDTAKATFPPDMQPVPDDLTTSPATADA